MGLQHAVHLGQTLVQILEIAQSECRDDGVERVVVEAQPCAVFVPEEYVVRESCPGHLMSAYVHHSLAYVAAHDSLRVQTLPCHDGKVARARSYVEHYADALGLVAQMVDGVAPPHAVDAQREYVVEAVVAVGYVVEHALHLAALAAFCSVGLYLLLCVHLLFVSEQVLGYVLLDA